MGWFRKKVVEEHVHKCWRCGTEWQHASPGDCTGDGHRKMHTCPAEGCGTQQYFIERYVDEVA